MGQINRVLDADVVADLSAHEAAGGGKALEAARASEPVAIIETIEESGLRGRGGGGFPTGTKWRTVAGMGGAEPVTIVVNAAEGEPGTLKDRTLLQRNPYKVLEGALIAAHAVAADRIVIGMKSSFGAVRGRVEAAIAEAKVAGWLENVTVECVSGSDRYLLGEETALLEAVNGRPPFPRLSPPYRAGAEAVEGRADPSTGQDLADAEGATGAAATLVNNVETLANVPGIVLWGPDEYRTLGTDQSPGTIVCTVSGRTERAGVGEFELGTPLRDVISTLGGAPLAPPIVAVLSGTANPILPGAALDSPVTWEALAEAGGGLGSAGFIVIDAEIDVVAVAHGVSRFLSVESCGQCTPCKEDGATVTTILNRIRSSAGEPDDLQRLPRLVSTVTDGARCYLAQQHQNVVGSLLSQFPEAVAAHTDGRAAGADTFPVVPLIDIVDDEALLDMTQLEVASDWGEGSGASPADRIDVRAAD
jgi:NADH-quinone oxidoreductase subunit F